MKHKKPLALILSLITALTLSIPAIAQEGNIPDKIIILHTNDVHCGIDDNIGYAGLVSCKAQMEQVYGRENVTLVDAGDAIQGGAIGTLSDGAFPVDIMNQAGYDIAVPGNHEFDYGMDNFLRLAEERAEYTYVCSNFINLKTGSSVFLPLKLFLTGTWMWLMWELIHRKALPNPPLCTSRMMRGIISMASVRGTMDRIYMITCRIP